MVDHLNRSRSSCQFLRKEAIVLAARRCPSALWKWTNETSLPPLSWRVGKSLASARQWYTTSSHSRGRSLCFGGPPELKNHQCLWEEVQRSLRALPGSGQKEFLWRKLEVQQKTLYQGVNQRVNHVLLYKCLRHVCACMVNDQGMAIFRSIRAKIRHGNVRCGDCLQKDFLLSSLEQASQSGKQAGTSSRPCHLLSHHID